MFKTHSGNVAKERLKLMMNADHQKLDDETMEAYEKRVVFRELEDYVIAVVIK